MTNKNGTRIHSRVERIKKASQAAAAQQNQMHATQSQVELDALVNKAELDALADSKVPAAVTPMSTVPVPQLPAAPPPKSFEETFLEQELDAEQVAEEGPPTVTGANGRFVRVDNIFGRALVKDPREVQEIKPTVLLSDLKIPRWIYDACVNFFRHVYNQMQSEVAVIFYYNRRTSQWQVVVPPQEVSAAQAKYSLEDPDALVDLITGEKADISMSAGWMMAGTAHSHCNMGAFHSGGDDSCELQFNGFHITFGRITSATEPDLACSLVVRGYRFKLTPQQTFEDLEFPTPSVPSAVMALVKKPAPVVVPTHRGYTGYGAHHPAPAAHYPAADLKKTASEPLPLPQGQGGNGAAGEDDRLAFLFGPRVDPKGGLVDYKGNPWKWMNEHGEPMSAFGAYAGGSPGDNSWGHESPERIDLDALPSSAWGEDEHDSAYIQSLLSASDLTGETP